MPQEEVQRLITHLCLHAKLTCRSFASICITLSALFHCNSMNQSAQYCTIFHYIHSVHAVGSVTSDMCRQGPSAAFVCAPWKHEHSLHGCCHLSDPAVGQALTSMCMAPWSCVVYCLLPEIAPANFAGRHLSSMLLRMQQQAELRLYNQSWIV